MLMTRRATIVGIVGIVAIAAASYAFIHLKEDNASGEIKYGITPYQDTVLPVVARDMGWYDREKLKVKFVDLGWSDVPLALASGSIDVALYNFDSFMSSWPQLTQSGKELVFYAPMYVWNGAAIMVRANGPLKPAGDLSGLSSDQRRSRIQETVQQLRGKKIAVTRGTTYEQTVLDALRLAGLDPIREVQIVNARPEDSLAGFLAGSVDAFSAGLTERVQARRQGAIELVIGPDISVPVLDGLITTRAYADAHPREMQKLVDLFFETVQYVGVDPASRSKGILDYLRGKASVDYSPAEYAIAWTFQHFARDRNQATKDFLQPDGHYYWKPIWETTSKFLVDQKKIPEPIPFSAFLGDRTIPKTQ